MFNFQHNHFLAAACDWCGSAELYNARVLGTKRAGSDVFDLLFAG